MMKFNYYIIKFIIYGILVLNIIYEKLGAHFSDFYTVK